MSTSTSFPEQHSACWPKQEAGAGAYYVLVAEGTARFLGRFNLYRFEDGHCRTRPTGSRSTPPAMAWRPRTVRELCRLAAAAGHVLHTLQGPATSQGRNIASRKSARQSRVFVPGRPGPTQPTIGGKAMAPGNQRDLADGGQTPVARGPARAATRGQALGAVPPGSSRLPYAGRADAWSWRPVVHVPPRCVLVPSSKVTRWAPQVGVDNGASHDP